MTLSAANIAPDFATRRSITAEELRHLQEPAVIFEHHGVDSDGAEFYVYTVAGWINGQNIATLQGGATIGGDVIVIHADSREMADAIAGLGLQDTIDELNREDERLIDAIAARERLASVGALDRLELAIRNDKSERFEEDSAKARVLGGDDIILTSGH